MCFYGGVSFLMANGQYKRVRDIKHNDVLYGGAVVLLVIEYRIETMVNRDIGLTAWHSYHSMVGRWFILNEEKVLDKEDVVYNFHLSKEHVVYMDNGYSTVTLGHGMFRNGLDHPYYATKQCIEDLKVHKDFKKGFVVIKNMIKRRVTNEGGWRMVYRIDLVS